MMMLTLVGGRWQEPRILVSSERALGSSVMQADSAVCQEIIRPSCNALPSPAHLVDLWRNLTGRTAESIEYHVQVLEDEEFLEVKALRSIAGGDAHAPVQYVCLSHSLTADRFLKPQSHSPVD